MTKTTGRGRYRSDNYRVVEVGEKYGRLTILSVSGGAPSQAACVCLCECGQKIERKAAALYGGNTKSCGCLKMDSAIKRMTKHGGARPGLEHPLYWGWSQMRRRCEVKTHQNYPSYGGRGISVFPAWEEFADFRDWILENLGPRPDGMTLDRIDNDGNYEPGNVRWATQGQQCANVRTVADLQRKLDEAMATIKKMQSE